MENKYAIPVPNNEMARASYQKATSIFEEFTNDIETFPDQNPFSTLQNQINDIRTRCGWTISEASWLAQMLFKYMLGPKVINKKKMEDEGHPSRKKIIWGLINSILTLLCPIKAAVFAQMPCFIRSFNFGNLYHFSVVVFVFVC